MRIIFLVVALSLSLRICPSAGKEFTRRTSFTKRKDWQYLTKFTTLGNEKTREAGEWRIAAKFKKKYVVQTDDNRGTNFEVSIFNESTYEKALKESICESKNMYSEQSVPVYIPHTGIYGEMVISPLTATPQPTTYFLVVSDCKRNLHSSHHRMPAIELSVHIVGIENTEFSYEDNGLLSFYTLFTLLFLGLGTLIGYKYVKEAKAIQKMDSPLMVLTISISASGVAMLFEYFHLLKYYGDGYGIPAFHILSLMFDVSAQFITVCLLTLIAWGWTITYAQFEDIDLYAPLIGLLTMIHMVISGLTYINYDSYYKYHDFQGIQGILLVLVRIGLYVYFVFGYFDTINLCMLKAKLFLRRFLFYSSLYILAFPAILIYASLFSQNYSMNWVVTVGNVTTNFLAILSLLYLFSYKGEYFRVSKQSESILPGKGN